MARERWNEPVTVVKNVGAKRAEALAKLGIETVGDLALHFPRAYQNRGDVSTVAKVRERILEKRRERLGTEPWSAAEEGANLSSDPVALVLTIASEPSARMVRRGMVLVKVRAFDETGPCELTYFNMTYVKDAMHTGEVFRFFGRFTLSGNRLQGANPIFEAVRAGIVLPEIVPVYPLTAGVSQKVMAGLVSDALRMVSPELAEFLPAAVLCEMELPSYAYMVTNLHHPETVEALAAARRRRVFEELFLLFCAMAASERREKRENVRPFSDTDTAPFLGVLPFSLTGAQSQCVGEIAADLNGPFLMNRMLTGDVGSGKTAVAAAAVYLAVKNGYRAAVMAPTEILAGQHYKDLSSLFEPLGIRCALLTGSTGKRERERIRAALREEKSPKPETEPLPGLAVPSPRGSSVDVVIGTHALLTEDVVIDRLGLALIDEQHRFGVAQRAALMEKCESVHSLVMSATPIPRTLALALYGDLDVSRIDEMPAGRRKTDTFVVDERYRARLNGFIASQVSLGHQVYVVCPSVSGPSVSGPSVKKRETEDSEELSNVTFADTYEGERDLPPLKAAETHAEELRQALPSLRVALLHGRMKTAEKERVMEAFAAGEIDVLVATTVIEVGINVPNATLMIVENAERFGLSQLHQLRGRVGRGGAKSYFVLVSDAGGEAARSRLLAVKSTSDGYRIAEFDLEQRGPGDFIGSGEGASLKQHGQARLTLAAGCRDTGLVESAVRLARQTVDSDPALASPDHEALAQRVRELLRRGASTVN